MSEVRRDGYNYHNTYVESVEWQRDKAYARAYAAEARAEKLAATLREIERGDAVHRMNANKAHVCAECNRVIGIAAHAIAEIEGEKRD